MVYPCQSRCRMSTSTTQITLSHPHRNYRPHLKRHSTWPWHHHHHHRCNCNICKISGAFLHLSLITTTTTTTPNRTHLVKFRSIRLPFARCLLLRASNQYICTRTRTRTRTRTPIRCLRTQRARPTTPPTHVLTTTPHQVCVGLARLCIALWQVLLRLLCELKTAKWVIVVVMVVVVVFIAVIVVAPLLQTHIWWIAARAPLEVSQPHCSRTGTTTTVVAVVTSTGMGMVLHLVEVAVCKIYSTRTTIVSIVTIATAATTSVVFLILAVQLRLRPLLRLRLQQRQQWCLCQRLQNGSLTDGTIILIVILTTPQLRPLPFPLPLTLPQRLTLLLPP